jgi:hypothetical protein
MQSFPFRLLGSVFVGADQVKCSGHNMLGYYIIMKTCAVDYRYKFWGRVRVMVEVLLVINVR